MSIGDLGWLGWWAAGLAALAAGAWVRGPRARVVERAVASENDSNRDPVLAVPEWAAGDRPPGWRGVIRGRGDAPRWTTRILICAVGALPLTGVVASVLSSPPAWLLWPVLSAAGALGLGVLEPASARRRLRQLIMETPQALDLLAGCLAAGLPPRNATRAVVEVFGGPLSTDLGTVLSAIELGLSDARAWRALRGHPTLGEAAVDLARSVDSGTRLVETLAHYAAEARRRRAGTIEVAARAVGVRCVLPMMACFIPAFILLGIVPTVVSAFLGAIPRLG